MVLSFFRHIPGQYTEIGQCQHLTYAPFMIVSPPIQCYITSADEMLVFLVVMPCGLVGISVMEKHTVSIFRTDSIFLQNVCIYLQVHTMLLLTTQKKNTNIFTTAKTSDLTLLSYSSVWFNPHVLYRERAVIVF
jgi:hypothetical protein